MVLHSLFINIMAFVLQNIKDAQHTIKWLKDSRKVIVRRKVSIIQKVNTCIAQ
jgi:hypothetical protein